MRKYLFEIANNLISAALTRASKDNVSEKLASLLSHIKEHFEYEETAQREAGFPDWKEHTKIHDGLVEKALGLKKSFDEDTIKVTDLFSFMVDDVVYGHMMVEDIKFYPYLKNNYTS
ncbi:MAG TPA: hemerythrin family protein [Clostridia bacterium]|nr:hemerythrin family protein [Clostridia bacterium]